MWLDMAITHWTPPAINETQYWVLHSWWRECPSHRRNRDVHSWLDSESVWMLEDVTICSLWNTLLLATFRFPSWFKHVSPIFMWQSWFNLHTWQRTTPLIPFGLMVALWELFSIIHFYFLWSLWLHLLDLCAILQWIRSLCIHVDLHLWCENTDCDIQLQLNRDEAQVDTKRFDLIRTPCLALSYITSCSVLTHGH